MPTMRASFFSVWNWAAPWGETFTPLLPVCAAPPSAKIKHNSTHLRISMRPSEGVTYHTAPLTREPAWLSEEGSRHGNEEIHIDTGQSRGSYCRSTSGRAATVRGR